MIYNELNAYLSILGSKALDSKIIQTVVSFKIRGKYHINVQDKEFHPLFKALVLMEDDRIDINDLIYESVAGIDFAFGENFNPNEIKNPKYVLKYPKDLFKDSQFH